MTDTFRRVYKPLSEGQKMQMEAVKVKAEELEEIIDKCKSPENGRLMAMAQSHLEIAIMCAVKGITK